MSCQSYPALVGGFGRRTAAASSACWISAAAGQQHGRAARTLPAREILGVDSSPDMIEAARKAYPDIDFQLCDVSTHR